MQPAEILAAAQSIESWIVDIRRQLHRHPELMYEEFETSKLVQTHLSELGIPFEHDIAITGVVATLGNGNGPCVALRADMDALPIHEEADIDFKSEIDGRMHACGHDCHTSMLLGAAKLLKNHEDLLQGTVKLIFQPAEEGGAGGERMRDEGVLENPDVQRIFGLHVAPTLPTGMLASRAGTLLAAAGALKIVVQGKGGHAARPHDTIDPVVTGSKIVVELQTILSRELDPLEAGVISITMMHGGTAFNVIPPEIEIQGTIRSLTLDGLKHLQSRVEEIAIGIAKVNRCEAVVTFPGNDYPPTVNDEHCWELAQQAVGEILGETQVLEMEPVMGGEDFAYYTQQVPGCFAFLGVGNEEIGATYGVHHPQFKVDEQALHYGSAIHMHYALKSLAELSS
ncbi:MAG TPA: amidohydrolase [Planctomycetaceae bacterium]|nr:amidohydrolase [Planctomycetaceae bacterium]